MYLPIIRGRQYDLLALRELQQQGRLSDKIIPVIEPVKLSSTLLSTVKSFEDNNKQLIIVTNPSVGPFSEELNDDQVYQQYLQLMESTNVIAGHFFNRSSDEQLTRLLDECNLALENIVVVHNERNLIPLYKDIYTSQSPMYNLVPLNNTFKRQMNGLNLIGLDDKFNKLLRNADYLEVESEFFSEEHLHFEDEGYMGFSDYSMVGEDYSEGGFAPYAVAIHIVHPTEDNSLEIMHFVSDSNEDISDPAGKFSEALEKMMNWYNDLDDTRINTLAMEYFVRHYNEGTYPGLPTLKKLSIMHHIEVVDNLLQEH